MTIQSQSYMHKTKSKSPIPLLLLTHISIATTNITRIGSRTSIGNHPSSCTTWPIRASPTTSTSTATRGGIISIIPLSVPRIHLNSLNHERIFKFQIRSSTTTSSSSSTTTSSSSTSTSTKKVKYAIQSMRYNFIEKDVVVVVVI